MSFLINPFVFAAAGGDFESIATVTVGSGGASSIEFTSIPASFQHLQIRVLSRCDLSGNAGSAETLNLRINGVSTSSYAGHQLSGNGTSASAGADSSVTSMTRVGRAGTSNLSANVFGVAVIDILDYANASKNTTARGFTGVENNGSGFIYVGSGLYTATSAVTSISLNPPFSFVQHSTAALYGLKAPA